MDSAAEIWNTLKQNFAQPDDTRVCNLQYTLGNVSQGARTVDVYFIELKGIWEELRNYRPLPHCECGSYNPGCFKKYTDQFQKDMVFRFLNGLNKSFSAIRSQVLLMDLIPGLDKVYSLILREESQRNILVQPQPLLESSAIYTAADNKKKARKDIICNHCGKKGHTKDECYKIISFLDDFKFTKGGRSNPRRGKNLVNNVFAVSDASTDSESQVETEEEQASAGFVCQLSMIKQQVNKLMQLLSENGISSNEGHPFMDCDWGY
ncbi:PREDICTED: uncharacterized protein LOC18599223 isoform X2 [Theobroma cacao]|uniref:Uncharacterized protein LOC18599223 isoform X2 n=1 Tax=Theobroma cacao TaxID=3641 RepID=A0AB32V5D0_THECC|nr:PREDICTED: uncharacterized protein LOC18599223 isoform X2 [Theobroma cacao]